MLFLTFTPFLASSESSLLTPSSPSADSGGVTPTRAISPLPSILATVVAVLIPLSRSFYYTAVVVTAFTVSYTMIFIALCSRMSDIMREEKVAMTRAIATFKDLRYTLGPLLAGFLIEAIGMTDTFYVVGAFFVVLLPVALILRDQF